MKEIIYIVSALHGGGAERVVTILAEKAREAGDRVTILMIAGDENVYSLHSDIELVSIAGASGGNPLIRLKRIWALRRFIKSRPGAEVIAFSTIINMFAIIALWGLPNELTVSERNDPARSKHISLRNRIYRAGARRGVRFAFQTPGAMEYFKDYKAIIDNSFILPNPLRPDLPEPLPEGSPRRKIIAAAGRLETQKNYPMMLQAFALFNDRIPGYELHIYGKGSLREQLEELAEGLGIGEQVSFMGFVPDVPAEIRDHALFIMTSDYEGMPNALMEAAAIGLPCISTDCPSGGPAYLKSRGYDITLTPVSDPRAFADAMVGLL